MGDKKDAGKGKRGGKGRVSVPNFANLEPRSLTDKQGSMYVAFHACIWTNDLSYLNNLYSPIPWR